MSDIKKDNNKIELPKLKNDNNSKNNLLKQEKKNNLTKQKKNNNNKANMSKPKNDNNNQNNLTKQKKESPNKNNLSKSKNSNINQKNLSKAKHEKSDKIELPKLKNNNNKSEIYTITLEDVVKLVENHEINQKNRPETRKNNNIRKKEIKEPKEPKELKVDKITIINQEEKQQINNTNNEDKELKQEAVTKKDETYKNSEKIKSKKVIKGKLISLIILLIMIPVLAFSTYKIVNYLIETPKTKNLIKEINDTTEVKEYESDEAEIIKSDEKPNTPYWNFIKMNLIDVDFNSLKNTNSDTVAWLFVGGTNVNYPVVQTSDNEFYLNHSFDKKKNSGGWLFMDYRNDKNDYGRNTIIYGHNMKNLTMFGTLKNLLSKSWYNTEENRIIKMSSEKYNTLWQIYSVYTLETTSDYIQTEFSSDEEYQAFIDLVKGRSIANFNTSVTTSDKTLTLSTCHGSAKKLVVHAKLIKIEAK